MATENAPGPVNGTYPSFQTQNFVANDQAYLNNVAASSNSNSSNNINAYSNIGQSDYSKSVEKNGNSGATDIPKAEVGWYFVERYYTTLSRSPEKLHLFYNKRSQFVSGVEAEKISVCVGLKPINDRIKELDFRDCKVRVTNVDSQGSDQNIVIQVIGEISNNSAPHRKFVQTFVLAGQTNGYFVLNDVFRYIADEEEIEDDTLQPEQVRQQDRKGFNEPPPTAAGDAKQSTLGNSDDPKVVEQVASKVDEQLTNVIKGDKKQQEPSAMRTDASEAGENQNQATPEEENGVSANKNKSVSSEQITETTQTRAGPQTEARKEVGGDKANSSATKAPMEATTTPIEPPKPAAPKTWANLAAAANRVATPAVAVPSGTSTAQPQTRAASSADSQAASNAASNNGTGTVENAPATNVSNNSSSWHTAGIDHSKRQSRNIPQQQQTPQQQQQGNNENSMTRAYIKNVYESVDADELKSTLSKYGELAYFDVNRMKNCAFVDFANITGYQAAVASNPHQLGKDTIYVEERRPRPNYPIQRGGGMGRGRGGSDMRSGGPGRGNFFKDGGRGFSSRGRGGMSASRGRGVGQNA